jgi:hypothetical protein
MHDPSPTAPDVPVRRPTNQQILLIAAAAGGCDVRTVRRYLFTDRPVQAVTVGAIRAALAELGLPDPRAAK